MKMRPKDLWKRLMIKFRGEEGLDYGGVARYIYITFDVSRLIFCGLRVTKLFSTSLCSIKNIN